MDFEYYSKHMDWETFKRPTKMKWPTFRRPDKTTIYENPEVFSNLIKDLIKPIRNEKFNKIVTFEAQGFILGGAIAHKLKKSLVVLRKERGFSSYKLPVIRNSFTDYDGRKKALEIKKSSIRKGDRVLIVDDWINTGAQVKFAIKAIEKLGGKVVAITTLRAHKSRKTQILFDKYNLKAIGIKYS